MKKKDKDKTEITEEMEESLKETERVEEIEDTSEETPLEAELEALKDRYLRLQAEYSNYRRRTTEEKSNIYKLANERLIGELLPVLDNFERALSTMEKEKEAKPYLDGVELIQKSFIQVLEKEGLAVIEACGEEFDPNFHHAVLMEETEDKEAGIILEELEKGYTLKEKVIRPTMVIVSK